MISDWKEVSCTEVGEDLETYLCGCLHFFKEVLGGTHYIHGMKFVVKKNINNANIVSVFIDINTLFYYQNPICFRNLTCNFLYFMIGYLAGGRKSLLKDNNKISHGKESWALTECETHWFFKKD